MDNDAIRHTAEAHPLATFTDYTVTATGFYCGHCERERRGLVIRQLGEPKFAWELNVATVKQGH